MKHFLFSGNESPDEIKRILADNSEGTDEKTYLKRLSEDELREKSQEHIEALSEIENQNEVLAAAKAAHKAATSPLKLAVKSIFKTLRTKHEEVTERVYKMPNHENGMMEFVNEAGEVVETRRLKAEEKQGNIFPMRKVINE